MLEQYLQIGYPSFQALSEYCGLRIDTIVISLKTFIPYALLFYLLISLPAESAVLRVPRTYPTIQSAIDAANPMDVVLVAPGAYKENLDFKGKKITVKSVNGPQNTMIDGGQSGPVVLFKTGEDPSSVLEGFTICNGSGIQASGNPPPFVQCGGGIYCSHTSPTIRNNIIKNNILLDLHPFRITYGAGIFCDHGSPLVENNQILNNRIQNPNNTHVSPCGGGGIAVIGGSKPIIRNNLIQGNQGRVGHGVFSLNSTSKLENNRILENRQSPSAFYGVGGGGLACYKGALFLLDNLISGNYDRYGGGVYVGNCSYVIENNTFSFNESLKGGGILLGGVGKISHNRFYKNKSAIDGGAICFYGGVYSSISNNVITENWAGGAGGGVYVGYSDDTDVISQNIITYNTATVGGGIGFYGDTYTDHKPLLIANILKGNKSQDSGGGLSVINFSPRLVNNFILENETVYGGGIFCDNASSIITNNTISQNTAFRGGGVCIKGDSSLKITNTILWGNHAAHGPEIFTYLGNPLVTHCDVRGGWPGVGNINKDPLFVDTSRHDFHLRGDSPCKDAGDNNALGLPLEDFEGDPRAADNVADMGADEFYFHLYYTGNPSPGNMVKLCLTGPPQARPVMIWASLHKLDPPMSTPFGDWRLKLPLLYELALGVMPVSGVHEVIFRVPNGTPPLLFLQGMVGKTLTNLCEWND